MSFGQEHNNYEDVSGFRPESGALHGGQRSAVAASEFVAKVYQWMGAGLAVTAGVSFLVLSMESVARAVFASFYLLFLVELGLVWYLSSRIHSMSSSTAYGMFFLYSAMNGMTLTPIFLIYTSASIASTFVICAGMFGATAIYGYQTKKDLSSMGSYLFMGLIGCIIMGIVNMFLQSPVVYYFHGVVGVILFTLLTAYDMQKIKEIGQGQIGDSVMAEKSAIMGALALYLDFINLFLYLLRLFGNRRR